MPNSIDRSSLKEGMLFKKYDASKHYSKVSSQSLQSSDCSWVSSLTAALASHTSYLKEADIDVIVREEWAFEKTKFIAVDNIECFAAKTERMALVAFRGTELSITDGLQILAYQAHQPTMEDCIQDSSMRFRKSTQSSVLEDWNINVIVLTGHSLGGAIAMIAAIEWLGWAEDQNIMIKSIYTYGQPAVGKDEFAKYFDITLKIVAFVS